MTTKLSIYLPFGNSTPNCFSKEKIAARPKKATPFKFLKNSFLIKERNFSKTSKTKGTC